MNITQHKKQPGKIEYVAFNLLFCYRVLSASLQKQLPNNHLLDQSQQNNTARRCETCSKLTIKAPKQRQLPRSRVFIVNFEHISHLFLAFLSMTLTGKCLLGLRVGRLPNPKSYFYRDFT